MQKAQLKEQSLYRDLIRGAWEIAWHRRELWLLGLLASLLMMNGGAFEFITRAIFKISSGEPFSGSVAYAQIALDSMASGDAATQTSIFFTILLLAAVFALVVVVATAASGGLLGAAAKKALKRPTNPRGAFTDGMSKLGPLILTQAVGRIVIFCAFALAALGVYFTFADVGSMTLAIILFVVFAAATLIVSFLMMMTNAGIMVGGERWVNAVHDACRFLRKHWLISFEMIALIFVIALAAAVAIILVALVLLVPFALILIALAALHVTYGLTVLMFIYGLLALAAIVTVGSMLAVFEHAAWALLYVRLADRGAAPKLERLWRMIKNLKTNARSPKR